jgi:hypothetical protein
MQLPCSHHLIAAETASFGTTTAMHVAAHATAATTHYQPGKKCRHICGSRQVAVYTADAWDLIQYFCRKQTS